MTKQEMMERIELARVSREWNHFDISDSLKLISSKGLDDLYDLYYLGDSLGDNPPKTTKKVKINYLVSALPKIFIEEIQLLMSDEAIELLKKIHNMEDIEITPDLYHFVNSGYIYITPSGKVYLPETLKYIFYKLCMENEKTDL